MPVATLTHVEKSFGRRVLLDKVNLNIYRGDRIGLVGDNGSGKTTVFRILTGQMQIEAGVASVSDSAKVGHLSQDPTFDPTNTVVDEAELAFANLHELSHRMRDLEHEMEHLKDAELDAVLGKYQDVQHEFELAGGYAWRHKLEATLLGVGLERDVWEQNVATLSGGQRSRLALAKLLISSPDLLLLDEPTNHLDLAAIEWLEDYLIDFSGAVVLISHDRFLLDRLATRIVWLSRCKLHSYKGNYSAFVAQRELQELTQARQFEEQQADVEKQKEFIRRFGAGQRSKEAKGREKRLNRLLKSDAMIAEVRDTKKIRLSLDGERRAGDRVLEVRELSKSYGERALWQSIGFEVKRGERIGIIGPNGSGKTTLLEVLLGRRDADAGELRWGANLNIGYYDQRLGVDEFDAEASVIDEVWGDRDVKVQEVRDVLAMMLFRGEDVEKKISLLSGGERARVRLAQLLIDRPNVLVLDEPTNHLDIASREALEGALAHFTGTTLCVSHDRYFLDKTISRLLMLQPPAIVDFAGNYSGWAQKAKAKTPARPAQAKKPEAAKSKQSPQRADQPKKDNPYARPFGRLTVKELESQIAKSEARITECQGLLAQPNTYRDAKRSREVQAEIDTLSKKLEQLEAEYFAREK
jgi:ATP-binding cassette subfamily F protein 3